MARTLICHVPQDAAAARELGAALMGRGQAVSFDGEPDSPRHDRFSRLRLFDAVIVVWTEASAASAGLTQIAGHALHANLLVSVRAEGLDVTRLPLAFRKLNSFQVRDADAITRFVARLSTAQSSLKDMRAVEAVPAGSVPQQGGAPMQTSPTVHLPPPLPWQRHSGAAGTTEGQFSEDAAALVESAQTRRYEPPRIYPETARGESSGVLALAGAAEDDEVVRAVAGRLSLRVPRRMRVGEAETVAVRFGRPVSGDGADRDDLPPVEKMSVSLYGKGGAFDIRRGTATTQAVAHEQPAIGPSGEAVCAHWEWLVIPLKSGPQRLCVRVSATLEGRDGTPVSAALPDRDFDVAVSGVETGYQPAARGAAWPRLRALLGGWGRRW
jgi:hypothetical protein